MTTLCCFKAGGLNLGSSPLRFYCFILSAPVWMANFHLHNSQTHLKQLEPIIFIVVIALSSTSFFVFLLFYFDVKPIDFCFVVFFFFLKTGLC